MNVAFRKVWRDLWNNKARTLLVVASIAIGVLALGMITASNTLMTRQMTASQIASQPSHVQMGLRGLVDDGALKSLERLPEVAEMEGYLRAGIQWKPTLEAEWKDAGLIARDDYARQAFDVVELRAGAWPESDGIAVEFNHIAPYNLPPVGGTIYFEINGRARPMVVGGVVRDPLQIPQIGIMKTVGGLRGQIAQLYIAGVGVYCAISAEMWVFRGAVVRREGASGPGADHSIFLRGIPADTRLFTPELTAGRLLDPQDGRALLLNQKLAREIGVMRAVGASSVDVALIFMGEGLLLGVISWLPAIPLSIMAGGAFVEMIGDVINFPAQYYYSLDSVWIWLGVVVTLSLLASWLPARRATHISVRESLAYE